MNGRLQASGQSPEGRSSPPPEGQGHGMCTLPFPLPSCGEREHCVAAPNAITSPSVGAWGHAALLAVIAFAAFGLASLAAPEPAHAVCSVLSHHPCTPYFGSVFRRHPFTPYSCGVFSRPGCTPEIVFPLNQVPLLKVEGHAGPPEPLDREHPVDRLNEIGPLLSKCLELPPEDDAQAGMQLALKLPSGATASFSPIRASLMSHTTPRRRRRPLTKPPPLPCSSAARRCRSPTSSAAPLRGGPSWSPSRRPALSRRPTIAMTRPPPRRASRSLNWLIALPHAIAGRPS